MNALFGRKKGQHGSQEASEKPCMKCLRDAARADDKSLPEYKKGHDDDCPHSNAFKAKKKKLYDARQSAKMKEFLNPASNKATNTASSAKLLPPPTAAKQRATSATTKDNATDEGTALRVQPAANAFYHAPQAKQTTLVGAGKPSDDKLSRETLIPVIKERMGKVESLYNGTTASRPPLQVGAVIHYLLNDLLPPRYETNSNRRVRGKLSDERAAWLEQHLKSTGGMPYFDIPKQDHRYSRDPDYDVIQGMRIWIGCPELFQDGLELNCCEPGCLGKLIRTRFPFLKDNGIAVSTL